MATANILLSLRTLGAAATAAKVAAVGAAIYMLSKRVSSTVKEMNTFSRMWRHLKIDISEADRASKAMIPTMELMRSANQLTMGRVKATSSEFKTLAEMAIYAAKTTGVDMTESLRGFTNALSGGGTEYVRRFGMRISETAPPAEKLADFLRQAKVLLKDFKIELEGVDEELGSFKENFGTMVDLAWTRWATDNNTALGHWNETLGITVKLLSDMGKVEQELGLAQHSAIGSWMTLGHVIGGTAGEVRLYIDNLKDMKAQIDAMPSLQEHIAKTTGGQLPPALHWKKLQEEAPALGPVDPDLITGGKKKPWEKKTGTGGGGKKKPKKGSVEDLIANFGVAGAQVDASWLSAGGILEEDTWLEDLRERQQLAAEEAEIARINRMMAFEEAERDWAEHLARQESIYQVSQMETMLGIDQAYVDASYDLWQSSLRGKAMLLEQFFGTGAALMQAYNSQSAAANKSLFQYAKAMAVGQAIMKTYEAATSSYAAMAGIPYVGPVLGAIAAANAIAFGIAQVKNIQATKFDESGGGAKSIGSVGGGGGGAGGYGGYGGAGYGGGQGGGDTYYIVQGGLWASDDAADAIKNKFNENTSTGRWPHGWRDTD